jgi:toxin FitB
VNRVVLDTDVASRSFRRSLPPSLLTRLIGREPAITFITQGELTKWAERRQWGQLRRERMARWLERIPVLHSTDDIAVVWGQLAAAAERRGRPRPQNDTWVAACCVAYDLPLATFNIKDFGDFAEHEGLTLITE